KFHGGTLIAMRLIRLLLVVALSATCCVAADLTGNWLAATPLPDGTNRNVYFDLKQQDSKITGHIRLTQFYYTITESTGTPDAFTVTGTLQDGKTLRRAVYEGKLVGDQLHMSTRRRADAPLTEVVAHRVPNGEGAMPARIEPPALHKVPYNRLAKTPPMGW